MTSREQRLITKEHIAMHTNLLTQYSGTLVIKLFNTWNSYCNTTSQPTFKTEVLHIVSSVQLVKGPVLRNERQIQHYLALLRQ